MDGIAEQGELGKDTAEESSCVEVALGSGIDWHVPCRFGEKVCGVRALPPVTRGSASRDTGLCLP